MIIILLALQALICAIIIHREIITLQSQNLASSLFFAVYAIVYVLEPLTLHIFFGGARSIVAGADNIFSDDLVYIIYNLIGITLLASSAFIGAYRQNANSLPANNADFGSKRLANYLALLICAGTALFVFATGENALDLLQSSRFSWFENDNFSVNLNALSAYLIALTPIYIYIVIVRSDYNRALLVAALVAILIYGIITKDRKWIFFIASGWLAAKYHKSDYRIEIGRTNLALLVALFVLLLLSQFLRDALPRYFLDDDYDPIAELPGWLAHLFEYSDLSYFYRATIEAIHQNLNNGFTISFGILRRVLFFFIPTGYSGGLKVEDISATFSDLVGGEDDLRRGSMPPGLFGVFIVSFGWFVTALMMPILAIALAKLDTLFRSKAGMAQLAIMTIYLTSVVFAFRGDESTAFYFPMINFLILWLLTSFAKVKIL